jgi:hypothetical protein
LRRRCADAPSIASRIPEIVGHCVDWAAVRQAFSEIGYAGSAVTELEKGDESSAAREGCGDDICFPG